MPEELYPVEAFEPKKFGEAVAWQVDAKDDLTLLFQSLGWNYDREKDAWVKTKNAIVGEEGFNLIFHYALRMMTKSVALSKLDETEIENLTLMCAEDITLTLGLEPWVYGIKDEYIDTVITSLILFTKSQLNRALNGFTNEGINSQIIRRYEMTTEKEEKKGIGGIRLPFIGKKEEEEG